MKKAYKRYYIVESINEDIEPNLVVSTLIGGVGADIKAILEIGNVGKIYKTNSNESYKKEIYNLDEIKKANNKNSMIGGSIITLKDITH